MARNKPLRPGVERYHEIQNVLWSTKVQVHPQDPLLVWDFGVSTEDTLRY
jgi:hypothetical protein